MNCRYRFGKPLLQELQQALQRAYRHGTWREVRRITALLWVGQGDSVEAGAETGFTGSAPTAKLLAAQAKPPNAPAVPRNSRRVHCSHMNRSSAERFCRSTGAPAKGHQPLHGTV